MVLLKCYLIVVFVFFWSQIVNADATSFEHIREENSAVDSHVLSDEPALPQNFDQGILYTHEFSLRGLKQIVEAPPTPTGPPPTPPGPSFVDDDAYDYEYNESYEYEYEYNELYENEYEYDESYEYQYEYNELYEYEYEESYENENEYEYNEYYENEYEYGEYYENEYEYEGDDDFLLPSPPSTPPPPPL